MIIIFFCLAVSKNNKSETLQKKKLWYFGIFVRRTKVATNPTPLQYSDTVLATVDIQPTSESEGSTSITNYSLPVNVVDEFVLIYVLTITYSNGKHDDKYRTVKQSIPYHKNDNYNDGRCEYNDEFIYNTY